MHGHGAGDSSAYGADGRRVSVLLHLTNELSPSVGVSSGWLILEEFQAVKRNFRSQSGLDMVR